MGRAEDGARDAASLVRVSVAHSPRAGVAFETDVELAVPATALDALRASGVLERWPELAGDAMSVGVWGRVVSPQTVVGDGDRVELYRPLTRDPQEARRLRAAKKARSGRSSLRSG
jgi:putative ubiquitin-RnfH superfamily antitoxin RatB of RatAB toxin-antitoxin module